MVRLVLFLSSLILLLACSNDSIKSYNVSSLSLEDRNGIVFNNDVPFTGRVFQLNSEQDTIAFWEYNKGKEHGEWKRFYVNGKLEEHRYFDNGIKIKTLTRWWENGRKQFLCSFKNGEYDGKLQEWNESGQLTKALNYKNGYEDGAQKMYYDNGKTRSNYVVRDGRRIGLLGTKNCINVSGSVFKK